MFRAWLESLPSPGTRRTYESAMRAYFRVVIGDISDLDTMAADYLSGGKNYRADVLKFFAERKDEIAPKTMSSFLSIIKNFLVDNGIDLPAGFWRKLSRRVRARPITHEDIPTSEELRRIFSHLNIRDRAYFHLLASSGCRPSEPLSITFDRLDIESHPPRAYLLGEHTKNRLPRVVFFTQEAIEALEEWFKVRLNWLWSVETRHWSKEFDKERVFPFSDDVLREGWRRALRNSGLMVQDERTGFASRRPHTLRKRFRTQMGATIPVDAVEAMMGHSGYETSAYRRYTEEELAEFYLQGEHVLYLSNEPAEVRRLAREMRERDARIEKLEQELKLLQAERLLDEALDEKD